MTNHRLDSCLKDVREQADILYDTITVSASEWNRWEQEITDEVGKLPRYATTVRPINEELVIVAELTWEKT